MAKIGKLVVLLRSGLWQAAVKNNCVKVLQNVTVRSVVGDRSQNRHRGRSAAYGRNRFQILMKQLLVERIRNYSILNKNLKWHDGERGLVGGFEHNRTCRACLLNLKPARGADAPLVPWLEARKAELRHRGGEVVTEKLRDAQKLLVHDAADGVDTEVVGARLAATGTVEAGHGLAAAHIQGLAENISTTGLYRFFDRFGAGHLLVSLKLIVSGGTKYPTFVKSLRGCAP